MARRKKATTGLISEMKAQIELAKDPNTLVSVSYTHLTLPTNREV